MDVLYINNDITYNYNPMLSYISCVHPYQQPTKQQTAIFTYYFDVRFLQNVQELLTL